MKFYVRTNKGVMYAKIDGELFNTLDIKGYLKPVVKNFVGKGKTTVWVFTEDFSYEISGYNVSINFWKDGYVEVV